MNRTQTHRKSIAAAGAIACTLLGVACSPHSSPSPSPSTNAPAASSKEPTADERRSRETSGGAFYVSYTPAPSPIPLNQVFELGVRVFTDAAMTIPADDVAVSADAAMPHHHHGMNLVPRAVRTGPGQFRVSGMLFHMPGYWEIYVDVKQGARQERARFEVNLK